MSHARKAYIHFLLAQRDGTPYSKHGFVYTRAFTSSAVMSLCSDVAFEVVRGT